jgi:CRP-like cAMP-binding protein
MYNTPRAASIVASSDCALWAMGRETFRTVILQVPRSRCRVGAACGVRGEG